MCHLVEAVLLLALAAVIAAACISTLHYWRFLAHVRACHYAYWVELGSPSISGEDASFRPHGFWSYFFDRLYVELGDPKASSLGDQARRWFGIGYGSAAALLLTFTLVQFLAKPHLASACWFVS